MDIKGAYLNRIKTVCDQTIASITLNGENMRQFHLRSGTRQECTFSPLLFNTVLKILAMTIREEKEIKQIQTVKEARSKTVIVCRCRDTTLRKPGKCHQKTTRVNQ